MLIWICTLAIIILIALVFFLCWLIKKNKYIGGDGGLKQRDYAYKLNLSNGHCVVKSILKKTIISHTTSIQKYGFYFYEPNYETYKNYTWMRYFGEIAKILGKEKPMKRKTLLQQYADTIGMNCDTTFYNAFLNSNMLMNFINAFDMERVDYLWDKTTPNPNTTLIGLQCNDLEDKDGVIPKYNKEYTITSESKTVFRWEDIGRGILSFILNMLINNNAQAMYGPMLLQHSAFINDYITHFEIFDGVYITTCSDDKIMFSLPPPPIDEPEGLADVETNKQDYKHIDIYSNLHEIRDAYIHNHNENIPCLLTYTQSNASKPINMLKIRDYVNNLALATIIQHWCLDQYKKERERHTIYNKYMHISWVYSLMQSKYNLNSVQTDILKVIFNPNYIVANPNFDDKENEQDNIYKYKPYIDEIVDNNVLYTRIMFSHVKDADVIFWLNDIFYDHEVDEHMSKYDITTYNNKFTALFAKFENAKELYIEWDKVDNYHFMKDIINAILKIFWYVYGQSIPLRLLIDYF